MAGDRQRNRGIGGNDADDPLFSTAQRRTTADTRVTSWTKREGYHMWTHLASCALASQPHQILHRYAVPLNMHRRLGQDALLSRKLTKRAYALRLGSNSAVVEDRGISSDAQGKAQLSIRDGTAVLQRDFPLPLSFVILPVCDHLHHFSSQPTRASERARNCNIEEPARKTRVLGLPIAYFVREKNSVLRFPLKASGSNQLSADPSNGSHKNIYGKLEESATTP